MMSPSNINNMESLYLFYHTFPSGKKILKWQTQIQKLTVVYIPMLTISKGLASMEKCISLVLLIWLQELATPGSTLGVYFILTN